jgi:hypothetical protein
MNTVYGICSLAVLYAAMTFNVPMIVATAAFAALFDYKSDNPVVSAYYVAHGVAREVTSLVSKALAGGAAELRLSDYGKEGHLDVTYVGQDAEVYRAILTRDSYLDVDPVAADQTEPDGPDDQTEPDDQPELLVDQIVAAYIERDGAPMKDMLPEIRRCAGPCGDFHRSSMFPDNEGEEREIPTCWMFVPVGELEEVKEDDVLVVAIRGSKERHALSMNSLFRLPVA